MFVPCFIVLLYTTVYGMYYFSVVLKTNSFRNHAKNAEKTLQEK